MRVHAITSDMGSANQAMWRVFGINASRYSKIRNACPLPTDNNRQLYIYADCPHAFKNLKAAFISHESLTIPPEFVKKYDLPTDKIKSSYLRDVLEEDENFELKLAPKLRPEFLNSQNHFLKMRVSASMRVFSDNVSSALEFLTEENPKDERLYYQQFGLLVLLHDGLK